MNIQPVTYSVCSPSFGGGSGSSKKFIDRALQYVMDKIPEVTFKDTGKLRNTLQKADEVLSRPLENRLVMGATALLTQPFIDYHNHKVDDETRTIARNRTIAKIIAGTAVGALVRGASYKIVEQMTKVGASGKYSQKLLPKKLIPEFTKTARFLKNYKNALSTCIALAAMLVTNFVLDAPLTKWLTNKFNSKDKKLKSIQQAKQLQQMQQMQQLQQLQQLQMQPVQEGRFVANV